MVELAVEERGREQRKAPSPPAEGAAVRFQIWTKWWQNQNNVKPAVTERNSKVNSQSSPSSEGRKGIQCSAELTTAVGHLLRASQQGLMQLFVCCSSASIVSFSDIVELVRAPQKHHQAPNPTANNREMDRGRLSPSSKQTVAMEIVEQAGCHGDSTRRRVLHYSSRKQRINCLFSPSSDVRRSVGSSLVLTEHRRLC